ncbi:GTPase [Arenibacter sp. GZD96]|uniref:hypothetical protein n=1 Tax=Aurantibrevibacter litoralis TaxID=3106030 RepID=UPI002AFF29D4|nr:hypothetical protein [Arenibacter sp. GZD-96]MEA1786761.1 GTPase [Arenibacter sp. GZD-96]
MKKNTLKKVLFIYNANSGKRNALLDSAHKIFSPDTYDCNLCDITFGVFTENKVWRQFRENSALPFVFLHKDEFLAQYASKFSAKFKYPIILAETQNDLEILVDTEKLNGLENAEALIALLQNEVVSS